MCTWSQVGDSRSTPLGEPLQAPLKGLVAMVGGKAWAISSPHPIQPEVSTGSRCSAPGLSAWCILMSRKLGCSLGWHPACRRSQHGPGNGLEAWVGHSDPIHLARLLKGDWSGRRFMRSAHGVRAWGKLQNSASFHPGLLALCLLWMQPQVEADFPLWVWFILFRLGVSSG